MINKDYPHSPPLSYRDKYDDWPGYSLVMQSDPANTEYNNNQNHENIDRFYLSRQRHWNP